MNESDLFKDLMNPVEEESDSRGKSAAIWLGVIAYATVILLTIGHSYNLIVQSVSSEVRWIAVFGFVGLELNAIALPLAKQYWTKTWSHKAAALLFWAIDLVLLYANVTVDAKTITHQAMPFWGQFYINNISQASPMITMVIWAVMFALDPKNRSKDKLRGLMQKAQEKALESAVMYFQSEEFLNAVKSNGRLVGRNVVKNVLGKNVLNGEYENIPELDEEVREEDSSSFGNFR